MNNKSSLSIGGVFKCELIRDGVKIDEWETHNIVTDEGLDHVLDVAIVNGTQIATWYVAPFKGNYTPDGTETGASVALDSTEATEYTGGTRPAYVPAAVSGQSTDNSASKASFTINATVTVYGAFIASDATKSGTGGKCFCIARFPSQRDLLNTDVLNITYTLSTQDIV